MSCKYCNYKGYIESSYMANNKVNRSIRVCPKCNNVKAYSDYVKSLYAPPTVENSKKDINENNVIDMSEYFKKK